MHTPAKKMLALLNSPEYAAATASYSSAFRHGAGRQSPGTGGFALWLLYDIHMRDNNNTAPSARDALSVAKEYGFNETSALNVLGKWCAFNEFRRPRTGAYSIGPSR